MGRESLFPEYFDWNSFFLDRPSSHKPSPAWAIIRAIYKDLQVCFVLCQDLLEVIENTNTDKVAPAAAIKGHNELRNGNSEKKPSTILKLLRYLSPWPSNKEQPSTDPHEDEMYNELKSLAESIVKGANSISIELSRRQKRSGWHKGGFTKTDEFDAIVRTLKGDIKASMQKSVHNKNSSLPTTEQAKEWSDKTANVIIETVNIIKKDLPWVRRL